MMIIETCRRTKRSRQKPKTPRKLQPVKIIKKQNPQLVASAWPENDAVITVFADSLAVVMKNKLRCLRRRFER